MNFRNKHLNKFVLEKGLSVDLVVRELESPESIFDESELPLISYPVDLIIEYLKHTHYLFVKQKLPYIGQLGCKGFRLTIRIIIQLKRT
jgi:regulator of cell morphogenesis and NO signaling